ncbi:MAG: prepilin-type N-terminal cleavage/methylation domain-containing protein [Defluviitaleaceae bacterium]|nr:prepilin-type N-terminal cleavage/methylation domain-containing protein [Defluviitaleaceae bacterium]
MNKVLNRFTQLKNNKKSGFTLVELIVVIVIIAILIAALTPAILGVINRANIAADEADARTVMMAASVVSFDGVLGSSGNYDAFQAAMNAELGVGSIPNDMRFDVYFRGNFAVGVRLVRPSGSNTVITRSPDSPGRFIGNTQALIAHGNAAAGENDPNFPNSVNPATGFERRTFTAGRIPAVAPPVTP